MSRTAENKFSPWLWLLLCVTLALTWTVNQQDDAVDVVQPKKNLKRENRTESDFSAQNSTQDLQLSARKSFESHTDLFAVVRPKPVFIPNVVKAPVQKMAPILPPLPFKYIGRWKDDAGLQVLLETNGEVLTVKTGDVLLNRYQVQNIQETTFNIVVEFLTMPENQKQILQVGKAKDE